MIQKEIPFPNFTFVLVCACWIFPQKSEKIAATFSPLKNSFDVISKCNGTDGCRPKEVADAVFTAIGKVGFVLGVSFPPVGAVIAVIASFGSFIASFLGNEPIRETPGLHAAAVVEASAFRAVKKAEDIGTFAEFADFESVLRTATKFNSNTLLDLQKLTRPDFSKDAQDPIDKIIDAWYDQYHEYKWVDLLSRMKDSGKAYFSAYGDITGSRRGVFANWAKTSNKTCQLEHYLEPDQKGRDKLNTCKVSDMPSIKYELGLHVEELVLIQSLPFSNSNSTI